MSDDLEQYVLLAKQATGKALEALVETVIASPSIHSFTALLEMPNVQSMAGTEYGGMLELLKIFSYGTYADYIQHRTSLPIINDLATHKLKKLTLISLAATQHVRRSSPPSTLETLKKGKKTDGQSIFPTPR